MANVLSMLKKQTSAVPPQRAALEANLKAITAARSKLAPITAKDQSAARDIIAADEAEQRVATLRAEIDQLVADARYAGEPAPDLTKENRALADAETALKVAAARARAAIVVRQRYAADVAAVHEETRLHVVHTNRLLFEATREELASLGDEFREAEARLLDVYRRAFGAARAVDKIAMEQSFGQFVGSGNVVDLRIARPDHPAFVDPMTPEQAHAARIEFLKSIEGAAEALVGRLLTHNA